MRRLFLLLVFLGLFAGCGKKGPLVPPGALPPAAIQNLRVEQKGESFFIAWQPPGKDIVGKKIAPPVRYNLYRREVLPPAQDCEECRNAYTLIKSIDPQAPGGVGRHNGGYIFVDDSIVPEKLYQYVVTSTGADGVESRYSNKARRKKVEVPPAPQLAATSVPPGILLEWEPVKVPEGTTIGGYLLYRQVTGKPATLGLVYQAASVDRKYEDVRVEKGISYTYSIRGIFSIQGEILEGKLSNSVEVTPTDPM